MKNIELAKKIKELRNRKALSQDELAEACELNLRTIQRIESGETEPRGHTLKRIANALGVTPDELIDWTEETDKAYLIMLNCAAFSFIVFPLLGVIIPLVLWVYKKDKIKLANETGKRLLNFQISWCIALFACYILFISMAIFHVNIRWLTIPGISTAELMILLIVVLYLLNTIAIVVNAVRSYMDKRVIYQPAFQFLK